MLFKRCSVLYGYVWVLCCKHTFDVCKINYLLTYLLTNSAIHPQHIVIVVCTEDFLLMHLSS